MQMLRLKVTWFGLLAWIVCAVSAPAMGAQPSAGNTIYRCVSNGAPIFSDRPCGVNAETVAVDPSTQNTYAPAPVTARATAVRATPKRVERVSTKPERDENEIQRAACLRIAQSLDSIQSKQRAGYRVREGERMRERQRQLDEQRRVRKCR